jgi:hypothetical protein
MIATRIPPPPAPEVPVVQLQLTARETRLIELSLREYGTGTFAFALAAELVKACPEAFISNTCPRGRS